VVVGAVIGVGIFFTPSSIARLVDSPGMAMLAWGLGGLIALCGAVVFAELGGMYQSSGAQYSILRDAYGRCIAFLFVFCNATAIEAGSIGVIAIFCAQSIAAAITSSPPGNVVIISMAVLLIVGLAGANIVGIRWGARIQNVTVYAKLLTLLAVIVLALAFGPHDQVVTTAVAASTAPKPAMWIALLAALGPALFSYGGWQQALWVAGEVREPHRNLPRSIVLGVLIVIAGYVLVNWAFLKLLGLKGVAESVSLPADAVAAAVPAWAGSAQRIVAAAVAISALGVLNVQLMTGPRLIYALAVDGLFFKPFAGVHPRFRTPLLSIALLAVLSMTLLAIAGPAGVDKLVTGVAFVDGIFLAMTGAALLLLRKRNPLGQRRIRLPGSTLTVVIFCVGELGLITGACLEESMRIPALIGVCWITAAAILYFLGFRRAGRAHQPT
jgi:APA family basic amino acid/polyamine antiporter